MKNGVPAPVDSELPQPLRAGGGEGSLLDTVAAGVGSGAAVAQGRAAAFKPRQVCSGAGGADMLGRVAPREGLEPVRSGQGCPHCCFRGAQSLAWCCRIGRPVSFRVSPRSSVWHLLFATLGLIPVLVWCGFRL